MRFFITKWVLARGILVIESKQQPKPIHESSYQYVQLHVPGLRHSYPLKVGQEVFLSLREAKADARRRFTRNLRRLQVELKRAQEALTKIEAGTGPKVHEPVKWLNQCKAF